MIEASLQQQITTDAAVAALIATRMYPVQWPDDPVFPLVTYQRISTVTESVLSGPLKLCTVRLQYDAWSATYAEAKAVIEAINAVLEGFHGQLSDGTQVDNIVLDSCLDFYDSPSLRYRVSSDYLVTFSR